MEEKNYTVNTTRMLHDLKEGLKDGEFIYTLHVTTLTLLFEKGVFTEDEYKKQFELYKSFLLTDK